MTSDHATPDEKSANLTALQRELADLATRNTPASRSPDRSRELRGPVLVVRGK